MLRILTLFGDDPWAATLLGEPGAGGKPSAELSALKCTGSHTCGLDQLGSVPAHLRVCQLAVNAEPPVLISSELKM